MRVDTDEPARHHVGRPCTRGRRSTWLLTAVLALGVALMLGALPSSAQQATLRGSRRIDAWTSDNGLPADLVLWELRRSPDGYLWMMTLRGLTRFDGTRFAVYNASNTPAFAGTATSQRPVLLDRHGRLWIATPKGLVWYANGRFHRGPRAAATVYKLAQAGDGTFWGLSNQGKVLRSVRDSSGEHMEAVSLPELPLKLPLELPLGISADGTGAVWIPYPSGRVARIDPGGAGRPLIRVFTRRDGIDADSSSSISPGHAGSVWISGARSVTRIRDGRFTRFSRPEDSPREIREIAEAPDGTVWAATVGGGVVRYDPRNGRFERIGRAEGLADDDVTSVFVDPHGSVWAGTVHGLNRIRAVAFDAVGELPALRGAPPDCLLRDSRGELWLSSVSGALVQGRQGAIGDRLTRVPLPPGGKILSMAAGRGKGLWIARYWGGVARVDGTGARRYTTPSGMSLGDVKSVFEDSRGTLWISARDAVIRVRAGRDTTFTERNGLHGIYVAAFVEGSDGVVWAGGVDGITRIANDSLRAYYAAPGTPDSVPLRGVITMYRDHAGTIWVGTREGLTRISDGPGGPRFANVRTRQGLPDNWINDVADDAQGNLWIEGLDAVARVSLTELNAVADRRKAALEHVAVFGRPEGLPGRPSVDASSCHRIARGDDGRLWFSTARGVAAIDPGHLPRDTVTPQVHFEDALIDGVPAAFAAGLTLSADARRLELRYSGVDLNAGPELRFTYQLDGFDPAWIDAGTARSVSYTNLPPGRYHFRVRARTTGGIWSANVAAVELRMLPPFYRTWWFALGAASLVLAALWAAYQAREHVLRARFAAVADERMRLAREMHDTLAQGLAGVVWQLAAARETLGPTAAAAAPQLDLADQVARETLRSARHAIAALRPGQRNAETLDAALRRVVAERERGGGTRLVVAVAGTPRPAPPDVEFELLRITQAALDNAIVHANAHRVLIEIVFEPGGGVCATVADDGCGFDVEAPHPGRFGLVGMSERAARIGAELTLVSSPGEGAEVVARWSPPVS